MGLGQFVDLRGDLTRKRGIDTPMHTMYKLVVHQLGDCGQAKDIFYEFYWQTLFIQQEKKY